MSFSHSGKTTSTVTHPGLSGKDRLRAYFEPRQVLRLKEAAQCIGQSYSYFFRGVQAGTLGLKIRKNEAGQRYVLLDDLITYIFPSEESPSSPPPAKKAKPGRPRKNVTSDGQKGGAR